VANPKHLELLQQGVDVWNAWRAEKPSIRPDLNGANLNGANLNGAELVGANLGGAKLNGAKLHGAFLFGATLIGVNLIGADLRRANLVKAKLSGANLSRATLTGATLNGAKLIGVSLIDADLRGADLYAAQLVGTNLVDATLTDCNIYGVSAWNVKLNERTKQQGLIITSPGEPAVTVDDLEVAQFVYLLLHNEKIRHVIDTVGKKGVLLLGRFTEGRIVVLERLRDELRKRGYLPIVFNFDKPETNDYTETVRLLAGLSKFVIADLTSPKSAPYELGAIVSQTMIPFQPIIAAGETPFAMLQDLWIDYPERVFKTIHYSSVDALIASLDAKIIRPAEARFAKLVRRKSQKMRGEHV
jgi:Pentapeptide repeats (8 copies)